MPIVTNVWSPNTCRCSFVVNLDTDLPPEQIDFIFQSVVRNCGEHGPLTGVALLVAAHSDNRRMNNVLAEAQKIQPALLPQNYLWSFDSSRVLHVSFELSKDPRLESGVVLSNAERGALRARVNSPSGPGKVSVT